MKKKIDKIIKKKRKIQICMELEDNKKVSSKNYTKERLRKIYNNRWNKKINRVSFRNNINKCTMGQSANLRKK